MERTGAPLPGSGVPGVSPYAYMCVCVSLVLIHEIVCLQRQWTSRTSKLPLATLRTHPMDWVTRWIYIEHGPRNMMRYSANIQTVSLIAAWIANYIHYKVWDEITYPFTNFNSATVEVCEWKSNFTQHFTEHVITYPCWDYKVCVY